MLLSPRLAAGAAGSIVAALVGLAAPASADDGGANAAERPIPANDTFFAYAGGEYTIDVLDNDTTSFLSTGPLSLCGVTVTTDAGKVIYAEIDQDDPSLVFIETSRTAQGNVTFTYDACQGSQRETAKVTVTIEQLDPLKVVKKNSAPGTLQVRNPNDVNVGLLWGSPRTSKADGKRSIPAGATVTIKVHRQRIAWLGYVPDRGTVIMAGDGTISDIRLPKK